MLAAIKESLSVDGAFYDFAVIAHSNKLVAQFADPRCTMNFDDTLSAMTGYLNGETVTNYQISDRPFDMSSFHTLFCYCSIATPVFTGETKVPMLNYCSAYQGKFGDTIVQVNTFYLVVSGFYRS